MLHVARVAVDSWRMAARRPRARSPFLTIGTLCGLHSRQPARRCFARLRLWCAIASLVPRRRSSSEGAHRCTTPRCCRIAFCSFGGLDLRRLEPSGPVRRPGPRERGRRGRALPRSRTLRRPGRPHRQTLKQAPLDHALIVCEQNAKLIAETSRRGEVYGVERS